MRSLARRPGRLVALSSTLAPDWICEVLSSGSARLDRGRKRDLYAREGVAFLWLVDPQEQSLEAFVLERGRWILAGTFTGQDTVRIPPFDAIELDLGRLWGG